MLFLKFKKFYLLRSKVIDPNLYIADLFTDGKFHQQKLFCRYIAVTMVIFMVKCARAFFALFDAGALHLFQQPELSLKYVLPRF